MTATPNEVDIWLARLRARYPSKAAQFTDDELRRSVAGWLALLEPLQLEDHADQVRFVNLAVLLTREQRRSPLVNGVIKRVMSHGEWSPRKRLNFVYKHIVGRPVAADEEDFGPRFVPF